MNKFEYIKAVIGNRDISNAEFRTLIALWLFADADSFTAYPSVSAISELLGKSQRAVSRDIAGLEKAGVLKPCRRGGKNTGTTVRKLLAPSVPDSKHEHVDHGQDVHVNMLTPEQDVHPQHEHVVHVTPEQGVHVNRSMNRSMNRSGSGVANADAPEPVETPKQSKRGTRLPENWQPDQATIGWTTRQPNPHKLNPNTEYEKFRDYWKAKPGKAGIKLDWNATWRNWWRQSLKYAERDNRGRYKNQQDLLAEMFSTAANLENGTFNQIPPFELAPGRSAA